MLLPRSYPSPTSPCPTPVYSLQDKCSSNLPPALPLPQPRTWFSQLSAWLIPASPSGVGLNVTSSERTREVKLLEQCHTAGQANLPIYANVQSDSRALAPSTLERKSSFSCMSCDNFLLSLSQLPFIVHFTSVSFICFFAFPIP